MLIPLSFLQNPPPSQKKSEREHFSVFFYRIQRKRKKKKRGKIISPDIKNQFNIKETWYVSNDEDNDDDDFELI